MLAQTMGRNVILPDQESMVNGIGIAYKFLAGKLRSQGVAIPDPPFRTRELLNDRAARSPVAAAPVEKKMLCLLSVRQTSEKWNLCQKSLRFSP